MKRKINNEKGEGVKKIKNKQEKKTKKIRGKAKIAQTY